MPEKLFPSMPSSQKCLPLTLSLHKWMKWKWTDIEYCLHPIYFNFGGYELWVECKFNVAIMISNIWSKSYFSLIFFVFHLGKKHAKVRAWLLYPLLARFYLNPIKKTSIDLVICWCEQCDIPLTNSHIFGHHALQT